MTSSRRPVVVNVLIVCALTLVVHAVESRNHVDQRHVISTDPDTASSSFSPNDDAIESNRKSGVTKVRGRRDADEEPTDDNMAAAADFEPEVKRYTGSSQKMAFRSDLGRKRSSGPSRRFAKFRTDFGKRASGPSRWSSATSVSANNRDNLKRFSAFRSDLGKRFATFRSDLGKRNEEVNGAGEDEVEAEAVGLDEGDVGLDRVDGVPDSAEEKRFAAFRSDLGKRRLPTTAFRSDLGK